MSELIDCINNLSAEDIIRSIAKTANGVPFYLQTTGAGVSFLPTDLTNLHLWLRSDLGITTVGNDVSVWTDQSGNGFDFGGAANRPEYVAAVLNGYPGVQFNGANTEFLIRSAGGSQLTIYTCFIVTQSTMTYCVGSSDNQRDHISPSTTSLTIRTSAGLITHSAWPLLSQFFVWEITDDGVNSNAWRSGVAPTISNPTATPGRLDFDQLGRYRAASGYGTGDLVEVIFYTDEKSAVDRATIRTYLTDRYAL